MTLDHGKTISPGVKTLQAMRRSPRLDAECNSVARGPLVSEYADFQNGTRTGPIELRYRGEGEIEQLVAVDEDMGLSRGLR